MILSPEELQWVTDRMKIYDIKYQEIYYEILDHILTAIELKRDNSDIRDISVVFQDVVDTDFGGYRGIEELALREEKIYSKYIRSSFNSILRSYFNWKVLAFTIIAVGLAYILPATKVMHEVLYVAIFLLAFSPLVYTFILISRSVSTIKGKRSLLKGHLVSQTYLPAMLLNGVMYFPVFFTDDTDNVYRMYRQLPLPILALSLIFFMLLNISAITLCNQVLKKQGIS